MKQYINGAMAILLILAFAACGGPEERKAKYRTRAQEYIQAGNFPKARVALRNVLKIDPKDAEGYFLFAQVEEKERNWRNAFANYQRVVELVPTHEKAQLRLAKYYLEARMVEKVTEIADKVMEKNPGNVHAQTLKIAVTAMNGQLSQAVGQGEALAHTYPNDAETALLLSALYSMQGRWPEAEKVLRRAIEADPSNLELLNGLGMVLTKASRFDAAEEIYKRIIALEPTVYDH